MEILSALILFAVVAVFVFHPILPGRTTDGGAETRVEELEARKEAKYRELRDTELDYAAGKLSDEDHRDRRATLRSEAAEILRQLDRPPPSFSN